MTPFSGTRIEMIREFTARRELVFQAMSDAKFVQRWLPQEPQAARQGNSDAA